MELTDHLRAIRKYWWITVLTLLATVGAAVYLTQRATPVYESTVTFYVAASTDTGTALQADEFAQRRINSYVGVLRSDLLAGQIAGRPGIDLEPQGVRSRISAVVDPETIILTTTVTDTDPERGLRIAEEIAESFGPLVAQLDSTEAASGARVSLTVISGPSLNPDPISPRPTLNLGVAALAGLALGVALSIARQMLDRSIRSADDLKTATGLPTLALIGAEPRARRSSPGGLLVDDASPGSPRAEAYRQLRTNLTFSAVTNRMQVVVVTSAVAGDGKTTTACNLAITLAESGRTVLLVEADMRRPMAAEHLGIEGGAGLTNILAGQVRAEEVIQTWGTDGLHVLTAGTLPPNPSELLGSDAMHKLVVELRDEFEVIVLDTPPVLPVTDASVVATHADSVVLVVRHARTEREQAHAAVEALSAVGAPLAGAILNAVPTKLLGAGGYGSYASLEPRRGRRRRRHRGAAASAARSAVQRPAADDVVPAVAEPEPDTSVPGGRSEGPAAATGHVAAADEQGATARTPGAADALPDAGLDAAPDGRVDADARAAADDGARATSGAPAPEPSDAPGAGEPTSEQPSGSPVGEPVPHER
ncbi:polysaccharide biosynthesis tyrosine autokinase [Actinotalea sp. AC32]|nr:polysaccharide biosynthesis tyrosine autokinase [Actinotalea sp. AC32]